MAFVCLVCLVYLVYLGRPYYQIDKIDIFNQTDPFRYSFALSLTVHRKTVAQRRLHYRSKRDDLAIQNLVPSKCCTVPRRVLEIRQ